MTVWVALLAAAWTALVLGEFAWHLADDSVLIEKLADVARRSPEPADVQYRDPAVARRPLQQAETVFHGGAWLVGMLVLGAAARSIRARRRERTQADGALRESEEKFRKAFITGPDSCHIGTLDEGVVLETNSGFERLFGYTREEAVGKTAGDLGLWEDYADRARLVAGIRSEGFVSELAARGRKKSGESFAGLLSASRLDFDGRPCFFAVVRDVTERERTAAALQSAMRDWQTTFDAVGDGILLLDADQRVLRTNKAGCEMFRASSGEIVGRPCWETAHGTTAPPPDCPMARTQQSLSRESAEFDQDGRRLVFTVDPILDEEGRYQGAVHSVRDVTERRLLEGQLQQAQKLESVGRLAGGVAHDFNNMLSVILGHAELALDGMDASHPIHRHLIQIEQAAGHSANLTNQLLAFARRQTVVPQVLDLNDTVSAMLKMLQRSLGEDIALVWIPGASPWPVRIDPTQLDQVLTNLCVNARDAIAGVGELTIDTHHATLDAAACDSVPGAAPGDYVVLAVSDTGAGIPPDMIARIFEPFFTTKQAGRGTGLGLATVYGIARQNGGFITLSSEPSAGTTFNVHLPRRVGENVGAAAPAAAVAPRGRGETVLLVEDEPGILELATEVLERQGYTVLDAGSPEEALRLARDHSGMIHLLLTDVVMPAMNGVELLREVVSLRPGIRSVFLSGYTADVIAARGVLSADVHFVQKPFTADALATKVRQALDQGIS